MFEMIIVGGVGLFIRRVACIRTGCRIDLTDKIMERTVAGSVTVFFPMFVDRDQSFMGMSQDGKHLQ